MLQNYRNAKHNDMLKLVINETAKSDSLDIHQEEKVEMREEKKINGTFCEFCDIGVWK